MPDLTAPEHCHSAQVEQAARWLADQAPGAIKPVVPTLQQRFGISQAEACETIALAGRYRMRRVAAS